MSEGASNLTEKENLEVKLYTVRAGLSLIAEESEKIHAAEQEYESWKNKNDSQNQAEETRYQNDHNKYVSDLKSIESAITYLTAEVSDTEADIKAEKKKRRSVKKSISKDKKFILFITPLLFAVSFVVVFILLSIIMTVFSFSSIMFMSDAMYSSDFDSSKIEEIAYIVMSCISFVVALGFSGYIFIKRMFGKKDDTDDTVSDLKKHLKETREELERAENDRAILMRNEPKRENYKFDEYIKNVNESKRQLNSEILPRAVAVARLFKESLDEYTNGWLDDRRYLDLYIFYLKTGHANSIEEAILLIDQQREMNQLSNMMTDALKQIKLSKEEIDLRVSDEILKFVEILNSNYKNLIYKSSNIIPDAFEIKQALLFKFDISSEDLVNELLYNQRHWSK